MAHFKTVCTCGKLLSQCRCASPNKEVRISKKPCTHEVVQSAYTGWTLDQIIHDFLDVRGDYNDEQGREHFKQAILVSEEFSSERK